jgi:predicted GNAT family acetyltransferase
LQIDLRDDGERLELVGQMDGHECVLEIRRWSDRILEFKQTTVPPALRGEGVGRRFVSAALDWARAGEHRVIPSCPFVKRYVEEHPEEGELVVERAAQPDPRRPGGPNP